jgi:hypothetical protein
MNHLVGKPEMKRSLGRSRCRGEDTIRTDLKEIRPDVDWINMAEDVEQWRVRSL